MIVSCNYKRFNICNSRIIKHAKYNHDLNTLPIILYEYMHYTVTRSAIIETISYIVTDFNLLCTKSVSISFRSRLNV